MCEFRKHFSQNYDFVFLNGIFYYNEEANLYKILLVLTPPLRSLQGEEPLSLPAIYNFLIFYLNILIRTYYSIDILFPISDNWEITVKVVSRDSCSLVQLWDSSYLRLKTLRAPDPLSRRRLHSFLSFNPIPGS